MTNQPELDSVKKLHRSIVAILHGQPQPTVGTALVICAADWLRQYNPPDLDEVQLNKLRIQILMRFLKGVAEEIGLGMEFGHLDDDDPPTFGNA